MLRPEPHGKPAAGGGSFKDKNDLENPISPPPQLDIDGLEVGEVKTPAVSRPDESFNGVKMVFRGPRKQVQKVAEQFASRGKTTVMSLPFQLGDKITKVELYMVTDHELFKATLQITSINCL